MPQIPTEELNTVQAYPMEFRGKADEYFGIWIVNLILSVITLGIWSAWAKARRLRYLHGAIVLDGDAFDYTATGWKIFKGRMIAVLILGVLVVLQWVSPIAGAVGIFLLLPVIPWALNSSIRFQCRNTMWRNVRFDFHGSYWKMAALLYLAPFISLFSLFLASPVVARWGATYMMGRLRFGRAAFAMTASVGAFYKAWVLPMVLGTVVVLVVMAGAWAWVGTDAVQVFSASTGVGEDGLPLDVGGMAIARIMVAYIVVVLVTSIVVMAIRIRYWIAAINATVIEGGHSLAARWTVSGFLGVLFTNLLLILVSFGLATPVAHIRMLRYLTTRLEVRSNGSLSAFVDDQAGSNSAVGAELSDLGDFTLSLT